MGGYAWLARLNDKARAKAAGTLDEYICLCPMDEGFLSRAGVEPAAYLEFIAQGKTDDDIVSFFDQRVTGRQREDANRWILIDKSSNLDRQDEEEIHT
ncbi:MAG: DUF5069 domain-containing protein [Candidatus Eremiobacteraeota bacterium]|nr:DUF5069 domain-containing protein [Candidatus Eremiobacteraeota bacterium]